MLMSFGLQQSGQAGSERDFVGSQRHVLMEFHALAGRDFGGGSSH